MVLAPSFGRRLRVIATVQDPLAVQAILAHLRRSGAPEPPGAAPPASAAIGETPRYRSGTGRQSPTGIGRLAGGRPVSLAHPHGRPDLDGHGLAHRQYRPEYAGRRLLEAVTRHRPRRVWLSVTTMKPRSSFFEGYPRLFEAAQAKGASLVIGGQALTPQLEDRLVASGFGTRLVHLKAFAGSLTA